MSTVHNQQKWFLSIDWIFSKLALCWLCLYCDF
jgi:hypothetical protein